MSIENETGVSNLIVWPRIQEKQRLPVFAARLLVKGKLQNESGVVHVVAEHLKDYSHWLGRLNALSLDFH
jgi:hypothetical protein